MYKRLLMVIPFGLLACGPVSGLESGTQPATSFQLKGVLISEFKRTALVNGQLVQEGDRVGGVEILAIDKEGIRVLVGVRELSVDVGGTFVGEQSSDDVNSVSRIGTHGQHAVKPGETLSGIALRYLRDGVTMNQMMIALFQSNPQAFSNNINVLHEGAILRIPGKIELHEHAPETATAEVVRHTDGWQAAYNQPIKVANSMSNKQYGPVESGETLSGIAASVLDDGVTMNQMMIALFRTNPQAFDDNINMLHAGAILRIPNEKELRRQTPDTATAEVVRQTKAWQTGYISIASATSTVPPAERIGQPLAFARASARSGASKRP